MGVSPRTGPFKNQNIKSTGHGARQVRANSKHYFFLLQFLLFFHDFSRAEHINGVIEDVMEWF